MKKMTDAELQELEVIDSSKEFMYSDRAWGRYSELMAKWRSEYGSCKEGSEEGNQARYKKD